MRFLFFFFLESCGDLQDLHSFPTRRSSDLCDSSAQLLVRVPHVQASTYVDLDGLVELRIDRKSTRLNSSHSQISYAVFCLKKKKNNKLHFIRLIMKVSPRLTHALLATTSFA